MSEAEKIQVNMDQEDLEAWEHFMSCKRLICKGGGIGIIEYRFQNYGDGMKLGTKSYSVIYRPHRRPPRGAAI